MHNCNEHFHMENEHFVYTILYYRLFSLYKCEIIWTLILLSVFITKRTDLKLYGSRYFRNDNFWFLENLFVYLSLWYKSNTIRFYLNCRKNKFLCFHELTLFILYLQMTNKRWKRRKQAHNKGTFRVKHTLPLPAKWNMNIYGSNFITSTN